MKVQKVTQDKNGDVRLLVSESKEGGKVSFMAELEKTAATLGSTVESRVALSRAMIFDLDETTTTEEISKALAVSVNAQEAVFHVSAIRKAGNGGYWAVVQLPTRFLADLLELGRIQVGWTNCRVREMLRPANCSRCFKFGHVVRDCKESATAQRRCFKCDKTGHEARACTGEAFCGSCSEAGHRADSMACPKYRALVNEMRERKGQMQRND